MHRALFQLNPRLSRAMKTGPAWLVYAACHCTCPPSLAGIVAKGSLKTVTISPSGMFASCTSLFVVAAVGVAALKDERGGLKLARRSTQAREQGDSLLVFLLVFEDMVRWLRGSVRKMKRSFFSLLLSPLQDGEPCWGTFRTFILAKPRSADNLFPPTIDIYSNSNIIFYFYLSLPLLL